MAVYVLKSGSNGYTDPTDGVVYPAGVTVARIVYDGVSSYVPPTGLILVPDDGSQPWTPTVILTAAQQAAALLAAGLTVVSSGTPSLNGIYALDAATQNAIVAVQAFIQANPGQFPSGATQPWIDVVGVPRVFPSTTEFTAFATAVARVVAQVNLFAAGIVAAPIMSVTIP